MNSFGDFTLGRTAAAALVLLMAASSSESAEPIVYSGAWAVRLESDVKASVSWMVNLGDRSQAAYTIFFVQPMIGIAGSGLFFGPEIGHVHAPIPAKNNWIKFRPKMGLVRTYNHPWTVDNDTAYGYVGVEMAKTNFFLGINGHFGVMSDGDSFFPSFGLGFGF